MGLVASQGDTGPIGPTGPTPTIQNFSTSNLTISSNQITITNSYNHLIPSSGITDTLNTINGGINGDLLLLDSLNTTDTITVNSGVGNIYLNGGFAFTLTNNNKLFLVNRGGTLWYEVSNSVIP